MDLLFERCGKICVASATQKGSPSDNTAQTPKELTYTHTHTILLWRERDAGELSCSDGVGERRTRAARRGSAQLFLWAHFWLRCTFSILLYFVVCEFDLADEIQSKNTRIEFIYRRRRAATADVNVDDNNAKCNAPIQALFFYRRMQASFSERESVSEYVWCTNQPIPTKCVYRNTQRDAVQLESVLDCFVCCCTHTHTALQLE